MGIITRAYFHIRSWYNIIQDFPGGVNSKSGHEKLLQYSVICFPKTAWKWKKLDPLDKPMIHVAHLCVVYFIFHDQGVNVKFRYRYGTSHSLSLMIISSSFQIQLYQTDIHKYS